MMTKFPTCDDICFAKEYCGCSYSEMEEAMALTRLCVDCKMWNGKKCDCRGLPRCKGNGCVTPEWNKFIDELAKASNYVKATINDLDEYSLILICLLVSKDNSYAMYELQKLIYIFQEKTNIKNVFTFKPGDYGPYNKTICDILLRLKLKGYIDYGSSSGATDYKLTPIGYEKAKDELNKSKLENRHYEYLIKLSNWIKSTPFSKIMGSLHSEYPHMCTKSVFATHKK